MVVKLVMFFRDGKRGEMSRFLENCSLNENESKLHPTNEDLTLLTFKMQTFEKEN
jgi:hypothetical protein